MASCSDPAYHGWSKLGKRSNMYVRSVESNYLCTIGRKQVSVKEKLQYEVATCL